MVHGLRTTLLILLASGVLGWALPRRIRTAVIERVQAILRRPKIVILFLWLIALVPMIYLTAMVRHYGVNVPTLDDWAMAPLIVKAHTGRLGIADIFQQQQEARTALPNLVFVVTSRVEWNVRDQMALSIVASCLTAVGLFVLLRRSGINLAALAICFWLMVLALFSTASFELWLFASGFPSFLPLLFIVFSFVAIGAPISTFAKFLACTALAAADTFTLANGLMAWFVTFPMLLISQRPPRWRGWLTAWIATAATCSAVYFWGYEKPAALPGFAPAVSPLEYVRFVLQFLGGGFAYALKQDPATAATIFGLVQLGLLAFVFCYYARRFRDRELAATVVPWLGLSLFAGGSAVLAAMGRIAYGASYALASRYVPFTVSLTIAVIALVALALRDLAKSYSSRRGAIIATVVLVTSYLIPFEIASGNTTFFLRAYSANDRLAKGAVLFSQAIDTRAVIKTKVFPPGPDHVVQNAAALDDLNLLRPPLARSNRLSALPHEMADGRRVTGLCETVTESGDVYRASGWAVLKNKGRPADCILIGYELPGAEPVVFAISDSVEMRWDIARKTRRPNDHVWAGWSATFPRAIVPAGAKLSFWAVDADEPRLYRLEQKSQ